MTAIYVKSYKNAINSTHRTIFKITTIAYSNFSHVRIKKLKHFYFVPAFWKEKLMYVVQITYRLNSIAEPTNVS